MVTEFRQPNVDDPQSWAFFFQIRALRRLADSDRGPLGFYVGLADRMINKGDISPLEQMVFAQLGRVWQALKEGRDPDAAYEVMSRGEMH